MKSDYTKGSYNLLEANFILSYFCKPLVSTVSGNGQRPQTEHLRAD